VTDAPHRLLLGHFTNWSKAKGRDVDVQLLESLLDLRATYDDLEPTLWPTGSVQDLLLRLVPAKGPTGPDRDFDRRCLRSALGVALYRLGDLGIFLQTGNEVTLNAWADVFVSAWLNLELGASEDDA
jgi:hypothetical protein